jgi:hypothetical protein
MTLRVVQVPDPPPGVDWSTVVPGQYIYDVTGITGTLNTATAHPTVVHDSSGNNNHGTYLYIAPAGPLFVPGLVAGDGAVSTYNSYPVLATEVDVPQSIVDWTTSFTVGWWEQSRAAFLNTYSGKFINANFDNLNGFGIDGSLFTLGTIKVFVDGGTGWETGAGVDVADGNPHFFAVTWDKGVSVLTLYKDGAAVPWVTVGTPPPVPIALTAGQAAFGYNGNPPEIIDEAFTIRAALSGADIAALYAARVTFPGWSAAVGAFSPTGFYHLDDNVGTGRQVALVVSKDAQVVEEIPTGFTAVPVPGPYFYSWQPNLQSSSFSANGLIMTVAIPHELLPAGYAIGGNTLDLSPTDQWTGVVVWWDDTIMNILDPANLYKFPPGYSLIYHQDKVPK